MPGFEVVRVKRQAEKAAFAVRADARHRQKRRGFEQSRLQIQNADRPAALGDEQTGGITGAWVTKIGG